MHIYYVANARLPTEKAHGYQIIKMCEAFAKQGFKISLFVPHRINPIKEDVFSYYGIQPNFKIQYFFFIDFFKFKFLSQKISHYLNQLLYAALVYVKIKPDKDVVLFTRSVELAWVLRGRGHSTIFECHEVPISRHRLFFALLKYQNKIVVTSQGIKDQILKYLPGLETKILVLPNAYDPGVFESNLTTIQARQDLHIQQHGFFVVYTGHLYEWKGVDILAQAAKFLPSGCFVYFIGGTIQDFEKFKKKYQFNNILNIPFTSRKQVAQWLKAADVLVLPNSSKSSFSKDQTSPIKMFEYMASRRPIVASRLPSLKEILNDGNCLFFEPDNPFDLAQNILELKNNLDLADGLADHAYRSVHIYTWENRARKLIEWF